MKIISNIGKIQTMEHQSEEGKRFVQRAINLANTLGISVSAALKKLHAEVANKMFLQNPDLQKWESDNFPEAKKDEEN